jgi:hypothetical protein
MAFREKIEFYKKRQFGDKLNMVIVFLRQNAGPFVKTQVFITGPVLLLVNFLMVSGQQEIFDFQNMAADPEGFLSSMLDSYGVAFLISIVSTSLLPTVTYSFMKSYQSDDLGEISIASISRASMQKIPAVLLYTILMMVIIMGSFIFIASVGAAMGIMGAILFIFIGFAVFCFLLSFLMLGSSIIIFEDKNPLTAISRAYKLSKGKRLSTFGLIVVTIIIAMLINSVFNLPQIVAMGVWAFNSVDEVSNGGILPDPPMYGQIVNVIFAILSTFGTLIAYSVIYIALAFQYFNLVERQESRGLLSEIEGLESGSESVEDEGEDY